MRPAWGRWYAYLLVGLLGGLLAWFTGALLFRVLVPPTGQTTRVMTYVLLHAALFGMVVGGMMALIDGWWDDSLWAAIKAQPATLMVGCFLGALIALTGQFLGFTFYEDLVPLIGPLGGRLLGFGLAGAIGLIDGIHHQSPKRIRNGALGGIIGGLLAGLLYHFLAVYVQVPLISANTLAFAFPLWGGGVLLGVSAATWVASSASLHGVRTNESPKYREGFSKLLFADQTNDIGSSPKCTFKVAMDELMSPLHAAIRCEQGRWWLQPKEGAGLISVNEKEINQNKELRHGDTITLGRTRFVFHRK